MTLRVLGMALATLLLACGDDDTDAPVPDASNAACPPVGCVSEDATGRWRVASACILEAPSAPDGCVGRVCDLGAEALGTLLLEADGSADVSFVARATGRCTTPRSCYEDGCPTDCVDTGEACDCANDVSGMVDLEGTWSTMPLGSSTFLRVQREEPRSEWGTGACARGDTLSFSALTQTIVGGHLESTKIRVTAERE